MADVPPTLKQADINIWKCAQKAAQLQTVKPVIAYWCEYWVVNQILARQLHADDEEVLAYTTRLMDKLEQTKAEYSNEEAITDDLVGQAAVLSFAQETLDRAERVVKANRVTQQTATTFDAAATFFHLVNIWGPPDPETQQKIKYAKWNAARILKAIKEGKDPNESNPRREEPEHEPAPDPEEALLDPSELGIAPRRPTVEEIPDADLRRDAAGVSLPHTPVSAVGSAAGEHELNLPGVPTYLGQPAASSPPLPPTAGSDAPPPLPSPISPPPAHDPANYYQQPTPPPPAEPPFVPPPIEPWRQSHQQPPHAESPVPPTLAPSSPPIQTPSHANARPSMPYSASNNSYVRAPAASASAVASANGYTTDEAAIAAAQKHAKWAISALNFEDVPTAVRELQRALETLGAT